MDVYSLGHNFLVSLGYLTGYGPPWPTMTPPGHWCVRPVKGLTLIRVRGKDLPATSHQLIGVKHPMIYRLSMAFYHPRCGCSGGFYTNFKSSQVMWDNLPIWPFAVAFCRLKWKKQQRTGIINYATTGAWKPGPLRDSTMGPWTRADP